MTIVTAFQTVSQTRAAAHPLVRLAAAAIEAFLTEQRVPDPPADLYAAWPEALKPAGAFVCLKREGRLRGCIGTTEPRWETLAVEVIKNAIAAASRDPRFPPVERSELAELVIGVDVLGASEAVDSAAELDPLRYGVIVSSGEKQSVLLPALEDILTVETQLEAARQKAGIGPEESVTLRRFEVVRYR